MKTGYWKLSRRLMALVGPLTGWMALAVLLGLLGHLAAAFITVLGGLGILRLEGLSQVASLGAILVVMGVLGLSRGLLRYGEQALNHYIAFKLLAVLRDRVFGALRRLCPAKLEGRDKGNLIAVITSDIELMEVFYAHTLSPVAIALLMTVVMVAFIGRYHWALGLWAATAYLLVGVAVPVMISRQSAGLGRRLREKAGGLSAYVLDSLRGLSETVQYGDGAARLSAMEERTETLSRDEARMKQRAARGTAAAHTVILLCDGIMLALAAALYGAGRVGFEGVLIPLLALMSSFGPVIALADLGSGLQQTFAAGERVLAILDESPLVEEITGQPEVSFSGAGAREAEFAYDGAPVLDRVSMEAGPGEIVGIVGESGSGKSTLLKLFMRFWPVSQGEIALSGRSVETINTDNLRRMEGYMTQQTHLFHDSVEQNLRLARPDVTREQIVAACKRASVHEFILSLPQGYDTPVGELGDTLSGGERQRLGLARIFLHDAPLMLLDEPTSNLDSFNEAVILRSLVEQRAGKTVVLVSHRRSTMGICDRVYTMDKGRMIS